MVMLGFPNGLLCFSSSGDGEYDLCTEKRTRSVVFHVSGGEFLPHASVTELIVKEMQLLTAFAVDRRLHVFALTSMCHCLITAARVPEFPTSLRPRHLCTMHRSTRTASTLGTTMSESFCFNGFEEKFSTRIGSPFPLLTPYTKSRA